MSENNEYKEFINKFAKFMNLSDLLIWHKPYQKTYTYEMAEKVLFKVIPDFNPAQILEKNYKNIICILTDNFMPSPTVFRPYRSMDYSFLDIYTENVKKTLIQQIDHDSYSINLPEEQRYEFIYNIDDLITVAEFYLGLPREADKNNKLSVLLDE